MVMQVDAVQFVVRANQELMELTRRVAKARGEHVSDFVRRAIKTELLRISPSLLTNFEKDALGISNFVAPRRRKQ